MNHMAPSDPVVMLSVPSSSMELPYVVIFPAVVIRPIGGVGRKPLSPGTV